MSKVNLDGAVAAEPSSTHPKEARKNMRTNRPLIQNVYLIWLDGNIDESTSDHHDTMTNLRHAMNTVQTFTDGEQCIEFLNDIVDEKACMIISSYLGRRIVPRIHHLSQVDSIFILCGNKNNHEGWTKDWSKIKGIFTEFEPICDALKQAAQQCEQNAMPISILGSLDGLNDQHLNGLEPSLIYTQIIKEILLSLTFEQQHIDEFIKRCRELLVDNSTELKNVDLLAQKYHQHTPIWWYTYECFLYPMINRAFRIMDVDLIIKLGFFIKDLHHHIEQLHREQFSTDDSKQQFIVYRGQGVEREVFEKIVASKGGLLSFNCFLVTSKNFQTSLDFAQRAESNSQLIGVLFVMNIDPAESSSPFASVIDVGYFGKLEDEVLFSMHTIFRIGEITPLDDECRLVQVELNLTSDQNSDLRPLIDHIRDETFPDAEGWYRLGQALWARGEPAKAQQVYEILLRTESNENAKASIYDQLGTIKAQAGEYLEAIVYYEKSIAMQGKQVPCDDQNLANAYNNIGLVYFNMGDYSKAISAHERALTIRQQSLPPIHPSLANSHNNIGLVYFNMGDYPKALSSHEQALAMKQQSLPSTHPSLANSYNNVGLVYFSMDDYPKALSSYEQALTIQLKSLPPTHPDLASSYNNIGNVYYNMGDYHKVLTFYEKALVIKQQSFPPTHPSLANSYNNIGLTHEKMENYSEARSCFQHAVGIGKHSLPPNHPDLQTWKKNLARIKEKL